MRKNLQYLYNVARQMMGVLQVWQFTSGDPKITDGISFYRLFQADVERELRTWGDDKLGLLAALGRGGGEANIERKEKGFGASPRTSLTDVGLGRVMTEFMSGRALLLKLASLTVVAAMLDLAKSYHQMGLMDMPDSWSHGS